MPLGKNSFKTSVTSFSTKFSCETDLRGHDAIKTCR